MKTLIIDIDKCNGCYNCQIACKDEHVGNDWSPYAKPQPDTGQFWMKVTDMVKGTIPKVKMRYMLEICQQCDAAPCITACRNGAIYKREDGIVIIDPKKCGGSRTCIAACPYDVIYFNKDLNISQKCTSCAHLLDKGLKEPRCVEVCPTGALQFGEEEEFRAVIDAAEILHPEFKTKPRVFYIGIPDKRFVAGAVYDPEADRCLEGATAVLTDLKTAERRQTLTDNYGDFWFEGLEIGDYSLIIEKKGYYTREVGSINTRKDINIGDIKMYPETGSQK